MKYYLNLSELIDINKEIGLYNKYFIYHIENNLGSFSFITKIIDNNFVFIKQNNVIKNNIYFIKKINYINFIKHISYNLNNVIYGFYIELVIIGLGFKLKRSKRYSNINLELQFSHQLIYKIPSDIIIRTSKKNIIVFGLNKERVSDVAHDLKNLRFPNIYKGTGIRFLNEIIKLKPGKQR